MATFITRDGRKIPFLDWAGVTRTASHEKIVLRIDRDVLEEPDSPRPPLIAANDLLDQNLLAFIQG